MVSITLRANDNAPIIVEKRHEIEKDSSEHNRINKKFETSAILLGSGPNATGGNSGISIGYYFDLNKMIILEGTGNTHNQNGNAFYSSSSSGGNISSHAFTKTSSYGIHFKHFTGNSFYYRIGADYRTVEYKYNFQSEEMGFNGDSITASFYIGNQWQWDSFTLGCDWVGLSAPISSKIKDSYKNSAAQTHDADYYDRKLNRETDDYIKNININLLRFYLGASF